MCKKKKVIVVVIGKINKEMWLACVCKGYGLLFGLDL